MTAFQRPTALDGRASAGAAGTPVRKDPPAPGGRPVLRCLGQRRDLGPTATGLSVALARAADLGVSHGMGTEVALDGLVRPHHVLVAELGAV